MFRRIAVAVLCLAVLVPGALAQTRVSATEKGSLLVYPKVEVRWRVIGGSLALIQDTFITLNNDFNASVAVQLYFVSESCTDVDNVITLTHNHPVYWSAATGQPLGVSPWTLLGDPLPDPELSGDLILRGYILAWAVDANGRQIRWNHLYGGATIVHYGWNAAWGYNAYAFQVVNPNVANGDAIGTAGVINLNGVDYAYGFQLLLLDFYASGAVSFSRPLPPQVWFHDTDLTLMIVNNDLRQDPAPGDPNWPPPPFTTKVIFDIWNTDETFFSGMEYCFTKWDERLLSSLGGHFLVQNLQTNRGHARIRTDASPTVCGIATNSSKESLLGVQCKVLRPDLAPFRVLAGGNLQGAGIANGLAGAPVSPKIKYDILPPPPEKVLGGGTVPVRLAPVRAD